MAQEIDLHRQDKATHFIDRDAESAEDRPGAYSWIIEAFENNNPTPFSFRAYDLTASQAEHLLECYNRMKA